MFTHLQRRNKIKRASSLVAALLFVLLLLPLLSPINAIAAAPKPSKDFPFCFTTIFTTVTDFDSINTPTDFCYVSLSECNTGATTFPKISPPCHDVYAGLSDVEKANAQKPVLTKLWDKVTGLAGDALLAIPIAILKLIGWALAGFSGKMLVWMGNILDISIDRTINSATYSDLNVVNVGWTAVRDLSNMFFIFVLLYIAILTILGQAGSSAKRWVVHLVIAAVLINFSMFFTKVVIDAGNALTVGIWNNLKEKKSGVDVNGVAQHFSEAFRVQTNFDTLGNDPTGVPYPQPDGLQQAMIYFGATLVQSIAAYLFLAGAIMMIIRTVTLLIVIIVSPFAFLGFALPKGGGFASEWLSKLIGATFVAPVFVFMLYLNSILIHTSDIDSLGGGQSAKWALAFQGNAGSFVIMYQFALMCIMLLASMTVAQKVGNGVGSSAGNLAQKYSRKGAGYVYNGAAATTGFVMRNTRGRAAANTLKNQKLIDLSKIDSDAGRRARAQLEVAERRAKSTYDYRNSAVGALIGGGMAAAGVKVNKGTAKYANQRRESVEKGEDEEIAKAKRLFPDDPQAQLLYLKERLGRNDGPEGANWDKSMATKLGMNEQFQTQFGEGRHKKLEKELETAVANKEKEERKEAAEAEIKKHPQEYDDLKTQLETLKANMAAPSVIADAEKNLSDSLIKFSQNMKLAGTDYIKDLKAGSPEMDKFIKSDAFMAASSPEHWKALEARDDIPVAKLREYRETALGKKDLNKRVHENLVKQMRNEDSRYYEDHKTAIKSRLAGYTDYDAESVELTSHDAVMSGGGALGAADQARYDAIKDKRIDVATRLGYMSPEQVASLDPDQVLHGAAASALTVPMIQEIIRTEKSSLKYGKEFFTDLKTKLDSDPNANKAAKQFVENASKNKSKENPFSVEYGT